MRIDLSPQGHVVGTRKVLENGQVSGLNEHIGKDVLILVPNGRPIVKNTMTDFIHEWQKIAERNAKRAAKEWNSFQKKVPRSREAALKLAKEQIEFARSHVDVERLVSKLPVAQARRTVEKRIKTARKQVREAQVWLRAKVPFSAVKVPAAKSARRTSRRKTSA